MEARGNLQLAVTARSSQNYFLYESSNTVEPAYSLVSCSKTTSITPRTSEPTLDTSMVYIFSIHTNSDGKIRGPGVEYVLFKRTSSFYYRSTEGVSIRQPWIVDPKASWNSFIQPDLDDSWLGLASLWDFLL